MYVRYLHDTITVTALNQVDSIAIIQPTFYRVASKVRISCKAHKPPYAITLGLLQVIIDRVLSYTNPSH